MRSFRTIALLASVPVFSRSTDPQLILQNDDHAEYDIPSIHQSAIMARRIAQLADHGELVSTFPSNLVVAEDIDAQETPGSLAGSPIGLIEYVADCETDGNPTLLAIDIATPYRNYRAGSNVSLALRWWPPQRSYYAKRAGSLWSQDINVPTPRTAVALPRFSLHGHIEPIDTRGFNGFKIAQCFIRKHPDSVYWQPGTGAHTSHYARFVVENIYWLGGFGDRARIGWLSLEEWQSVTQAEIDECRLPGEE